VCKQEHRGPRDLDVIHHEILRFTQRAAEMPMVEAAAYLRVNLLAHGFELSAFCANCTVNAQASVTAPSRRTRSRRCGRRTRSCRRRDAGRARTSIPGRPMHLCKILPLFPKRDLLDVDAKFDSQRKE
jgi:hypothetical protein